MNFTEKLASMSIVNVIILSVILIIIRVILKDTENPFLKQVAEFAESLAFAFLLVFLLIRPFMIQAYYIPSASMRPSLLEQDHLIANKFMYAFTDPKFKNVVIFKAPSAATENSRDIKPYTPPTNKLERFWDVVSNRDTRVDFIKRVIGEPGDEIRITEGYIRAKNGKLFNHREIAERLKVYAPKDKDGFIILKKDGVYQDGVKMDNSKVADALMLPKTDKFTVVPGEVYRNGQKLDEPYIAEDSQWPYPFDEQIAAKPDWIIKKDGEFWAKIPKDKYLVMGDNRNDSHDARFWGFLDRKSIQGQAMFVFWPLDRIKVIH